MQAIGVILVGILISQTGVYGHSIHKRLLNTTLDKENGINHKMENSTHLTPGPKSEVDAILVEDPAGLKLSFRDLLPNNIKYNHGDKNQKNKLNKSKEAKVEIGAPFFFFDIFPNAYDSQMEESKLDVGSEIPKRLGPGILPQKIKDEKNLKKETESFGEDDLGNIFRGLETTFVRPRDIFFATAMRDLLGGPFSPIILNEDAVYVIEKKFRR